MSYHDDGGYGYSDRPANLQAYCDSAYPLPSFQDNPEPHQSLFNLGQRIRTTEASEPSGRSAILWPLLTVSLAKLFTVLLATPMLRHLI
jgi:hypothetical protein